MVSETPTPDTLLRWIPLLPFAAALLHGISSGIVRRAVPRWLVWGLSCSAAVLAFALSLLGFFRLLARGEGERVLVDTAYTWIGAGIGDSRLAVDLGLRLDPLAAVLLLVVTGIAALVHVHAVAYLEADTRDDRGYQRCFGYLDLLLGSMCVLLLADNLALCFLGWEGVAIGGWLLAGFWYGDREHVRGGAELFVASRIGDVAFLVGTGLLFTAPLAAGLPASLLFADLEASLPALESLVLPAPLGLLGESWRRVDVIALCFLVAVCSRLAQLPLSFWLRAAEGTPAPAAALLLTPSLAGSGVYLVCRLAFLFQAAPAVQAALAWIGALGALVGALVAAAQQDARRVLVFSAMSQQGYLLLALGCGAFVAALFHVVVLAVALAALFLIVGSVLLALQQESRLDRMGDLGRRLPGTHAAAVLVVGVLIGVPGGSVFFSRGSVLTASFGSELLGRDWLYGIALFTTALTAFGLGRLHLLIFSGGSRVPFVLREGVRDAPPLMLWPVYGLAIFAVFGGLFGIPQSFANLGSGQLEASHSLANFLGAALPPAPRGPGDAVELWLAVYATLAAAGGFAAAAALYRGSPQTAARLAEAVPSLQRMLAARLHLDVPLEHLVVRPWVFVVERVLGSGLERRVLGEWLVGGAARLLYAGVQAGLRRLHAGLAHGYVFFMIAGTVAVIGYLLR